MSSFLAFIFLSVAAVAQAPTLNPTLVSVAQLASQAPQPQTQGIYTNISGPEATIISAFVAALFVSVGWVVVHRTALTRDRETRNHTDKRARDDRKLELLSTLTDWERRFVVLTDPDPCKRLYYDEGMRGLASAAERFRKDVSDKDTFDALKNQMTDINPEQLDSRGTSGRRDVVCESIRAFREFIRNV